MLEGLISVESVRHLIGARLVVIMLTSVNDLPAVEVGQSVKHALCNFAKDLLSSSSSKLLDLLVDTVETATFAELHSNRNGARGLVHKGAIVAANMIRRTVLVEVEFANNLLFDVGVGVCGDNLWVGNKISHNPMREYRDYTEQLTFNANTVFPSFNLHRVTAPPAPSPKLPSSTIFFCSLAACQPSSSRSSTSRGRPFSRLNLSRSGSKPFTLFSRSICTPPSRSEYTELIAEEGSELPPAGWRRPIANESAEYEEFADVGPLPLLSRPFCPFKFVVRGGGAGRPFGLRDDDSCGTLWLLPIGVASCNRGRAGREVGCGSCSFETSFPAAAMGAGPVPLTGLALGDGGMPKVSLGARGLPVLLRLPGTGGRRSGTEGVDIARLFCLSPGKNSSLGSAKVATVPLEMVYRGRPRGVGSKY